MEPLTFVVVFNAIFYSKLGLFIHYWLKLLQLTDISSKFVPNVLCNQTFGGDFELFRFIVIYCQLW